MRKYIMRSAIGFCLVAATPALAGDGPRLNVPRDQWLSPAQITDKLSAQGYQVREIETDDGAYEVDMVDKNGVRIDVHVHPATAELIPDYDD